MKIYFSGIDANNKTVRIKQQLAKGEDHKLLFSYVGGVRSGKPVKNPEKERELLEDLLSRSRTVP